MHVCWDNGNSGWTTFVHPGRIEWWHDEYGKPDDDFDADDLLAQQGGGH
jgi:hypothetical protein